MDWLQIGKGAHQDHILSLCLSNFYAKYIMQNARLGEVQTGIKILGRNINNFRYADDTTLMAENEKELKSLLMKMKEKWKSWLKTQHSKNEDHSIESHHIVANRWETVETVKDFIFLGSKITADGDCSHEIKLCLLLEIKAMKNLAY